MRFLTIIELPKTAYRVVKTPTAGERLLSLLTWIVLRLVVGLIAMNGYLNAGGQRLTKWAVFQNDRCRLAKVALAVSAAVIAEDALIALFSPLLPAVAA